MTYCPVLYKGCFLFLFYPVPRAMLSATINALIYSKRKKNLSTSLLGSETGCALIWKILRPSERNPIAIQALMII